MILGLKTMKQGHIYVQSHITNIYIINKKSQSISLYIKSMSILIAKHIGG